MSNPNLYRDDKDATAALAAERAEATRPECRATDGFSVCTEPPGHGPTHWDRRTQHEWSDDD